MTQSTKILFKLIHRRLALGSIAAYALFLFCIIIDSPLDGEYLPLLPFVGFGLAFFMGLQGLLSRTMFPVSDRQVAWIPMAAGGLVSLAGAAGLMLGQAFLCAGGWIIFDAIVGYWLPSVWVIPPVLFIILIFWRGLRINPGYTGFVGFLPIFIISPGKGGFLAPWLTELYFAMWPLWAVGCVFLVWEAPRQTAVLRRLDTKENGAGWIKFQVPDTTGPAYPTWPTRLADSLMGLTFFIIYMTIIFQLIIEPHSIMGNPSIIYLLILLFISFFFFGNAWRQNRASGMSALRAVGVMLIEATGVGYAFRDKLGVTRGEKVRCDSCGNWRMVWHAACPHCGDGQPEQETLSKAQTIQKPGFRSLMFPRHDPGAMAFRVIAPIYVLGFIILFNWWHWFGG